MIRPPPKSPLFPYTPLFRSGRVGRGRRQQLEHGGAVADRQHRLLDALLGVGLPVHAAQPERAGVELEGDRKSTRLNSSHSQISYAAFCLKKKQTHALSIACK